MGHGKEHDETTRLCFPASNNIPRPQPHPKNHFFKGDDLASRKDYVAGSEFESEVHFSLLGLTLNPKPLLDPGVR